MFQSGAPPILMSHLTLWLIPWTKSLKGSSGPRWAEKRGPSLDSSIGCDLLQIFETIDGVMAQTMRESIGAQH